MIRTEQDAAIRQLIAPSLRVPLVFSFPAAGDFALLDRWLEDVVQVGGSGQPPLKPRVGEVASENLARSWAFLHRVASLCPLLGQLGGLPVFERPVIEAIQCRVADVEAHLVFAVIDHVAPAVFQRVVGVALAICQWAMTTPLSDAARQTLFDTIANDCVTPMKSLVPSGKSTVPLLRVAHTKGVPFIHLGAGVYQLGWGSRARRMDRSTTELDTAMGLKLSHDKATAANLLRLAGLPAPVHAVVGSEVAALEVAAQLGFPLVVKPADRDRGEGVTVGVGDAAGLKDAFGHAHRLSRNRRVIVERQVGGECHRLFMVGGQLLYAVRRGAMAVIGDGWRSVSQLVADEVCQQALLPPWRRTEIRPLDDLARATLQRAGRSAEAVPGPGEPVPLRPIESTEWGGVDEDVTAKVHPENHQLAARAAELFGLHMAGVDIITLDIAVPWYESGAIVNEVNYAPLLGGGEISRRHIPLFLQQFMAGDGRVPIEWFTGTDAVRQALDRQAQMVAQGLRCFVTSGVQTLDPTHRDLRLAVQGLSGRVKALLCRPDVDAVIAVSR